MSIDNFYYLIGCFQPQANIDSNFI